MFKLAFILLKATLGSIQKVRHSQSDIFDPLPLCQTLSLFSPIPTASKVSKYGVFFWSVFLHIRTEYGVSVFISNAGKYEPEKNSVSEHFSRSSPSPCLTKKWKTMAWNKKGKKYQKIVLTCEHLHLYLWTHMY